NSHPLVYRTLRKDFVAAVITLAARNVVKDHHPVAGPEIRYARTDRRNLSRRFMAENPGRRMRTRHNLFQVGAADAAGMHADQYLSSADFRDGNGFQANIVLAAIHGGLHVGGY